MMRPNTMETHSSERDQRLAARRNFFRQAGGAVVAVGAGPLLAACGSDGDGERDPTPAARPQTSVFRQGTLKSNSVAEQGFIGTSPALANSSGVLSVVAVDAAKGFRWKSMDSILGSIDTGDANVSAWNYLAGAPSRLVFRGSGDGVTFYGDVIFEPYGRAVVDVVKGTRRVRYLLVQAMIEIVRFDGSEWQEDEEIPTISSRTLNRSAMAASSGVHAAPPSSAIPESIDQLELIAITLSEPLDPSLKNLIQVQTYNIFTEVSATYVGMEVKANSLIFDIRKGENILSGTFFHLRMTDYPVNSTTFPANISVTIIRTDQEGILRSEQRKLYMTPQEPGAYTELSASGDITFANNLSTALVHQLSVGSESRTEVFLHRLGPTSNEFQSADGSIKLESLKTLTLDPAVTDSAAFRVTIDQSTARISLLETTLNSGRFVKPTKPAPPDPGAPIVRATLQFSFSLDSLSAEFVMIGDKSIHDVLLSQVRSGFYESSDGLLSIEVVGVAPFDQETRDLRRFKFTLHGQAVWANALETAENSLRFITVQSALTAGATGFRESFVARQETFGFKIRYTSALPPPNSEIIVAGTLDGPTDRILDRAPVKLVAHNVYETDVLWAVRDYEELTAQAKSFYSNARLIRGSGTNVVVIIGGVVVGEVLLEFGDYLLDEVLAELWGLLDGKNSGAKIAWISNAWGGTPEFVDSTGTRFSERFDQAGWTDDWINYWAERNEILDDLRDMDGNDVFVFFGHSYNFSTGPEAQGLVGYSSKFVVGGDALSPRLLQWAMDGEAPGLVVIMGCRSADGGPLQQAFMSVPKPPKAYIGVTVEAENSTAGQVLIDFLEQLLVNKKTVQQAIDIATHKGQGDYRDYYFGADNPFPESWPADIVRKIQKQIEDGFGLDVEGVEVASDRQLIVMPSSAGDQTIHQLLGVRDPR